MTSSAIVIGAGITGVATALCLARDGCRVTLIDRNPPGDPAQASFGNGGLLARASIIPVQEPGLIWRAPGMLADRDAPLFLRWPYLPRLAPWLVPFLRNGAAERLDRIVPALWALTRDTVEAHRALAAGTPAERFITSGSYGYLFADRAAFAQEVEGYRRKAALGITWDERAAAEVDPALGRDYGFAAVLGEHGWISHPGRYVAALASAAKAAGAAVLRGEVRDLRATATGVAVETGDGRLTADRAVLAAGVWSGGLAKRLGLRVPIESERGYHIMLEAPSHRPPFPLMLTDRAVLVTPMEGALRFAGVVEFGGTAAPPSEAPFALIRRAIRRAYPDLTWESETTWMGHRPTLTDSLPALGPVPGAPAVICAFGGQHLGLTMGPRLGRLAADLVAGRRANIDLAPYAPGRFG